MFLYHNVVRISFSPARDEGKGYLEMWLDQLEDTDPYAMEYALRVHMRRVILEKVWKVRATFRARLPIDVRQATGDGADR